MGGLSVEKGEGINKYNTDQTSQGGGANAHQGSHQRCLSLFLGQSQRKDLER